MKSDIDNTFIGSPDYVLATLSVLEGVAKYENLATILQREDVRVYISNFSADHFVETKKCVEQIQKVYSKYSLSSPQDCYDAMQKIINQANVSVMWRPFNQSVHEDMAKLIGFLAKHFECKSLLNPFAGRATYARFLPDGCSYLGQENHPYVYKLAQYQLSLLHHDNYQIRLEDTFAGPVYGYDMLASDMPWGKIPTAHDTYEEFYLEMSSIMPMKIGLGLYPYGILFNQGKRYKSLRKSLIEYDFIDCVVKLPNRLMWPETGVQTCLVMTNHNKVQQGVVRFIDASSFVLSNESMVQLDWERLATFLTGASADETYVRVINNSELLENNDWSVEKYFVSELQVPEGYKPVKLKSILNVAHTRRKPDTKEVPLYQISDLASSPFEYSLGEKDAPLRPFLQSYKYIEVPSILIALIQRLKPTAFTPKHGGVYINQNMAAFSIKKGVNVSLQYLLNELSKDYVWKQQQYRGITIPYVKPESFLETSIFIPDAPEDQETDVFKTILHEQTYRNQVLSSELDVYLEEWGQRQHTFGHAVGALDDAIDALNSARELHHGVLHNDDVIDPDGTTVKDYFHKLAFAKERLANLVDHLADGIAWEEPEEISLIDFIEQYKKDHVQHNYTLELIYDQQENFIVRFANNRLLDVIDNIINNCKKHGFVEDRDDYVIRIELQETVMDKQPAVSILIMNNGKELDPSMDPEKVFKWGESTKGSGLGGSRIKLSVKTYGGTVEFLLKNNLPKDFNAAYKIVLPII